MIDGFRKLRNDTGLHPRDGERMTHGVFGDHSKDRFVPPEQVAANEEQASGSSMPPPKKKRSFKEWLKGLDKKQKVMLTGAAALGVSGLIIGSYFAFFSGSAPIVKPVAKKQVIQKEAPKPTTVASNLTGLQVDPSLNDRPVTAIMIENSTDARPQSGLNQAGVIFEAVAEGGITRFITFFQDTEPDYIGPVRSVRPYYIQWALGFDAAIAHAGGSAQALNDMKQLNVKDLNHAEPYFWRVGNRAAPHNLYTSIAKLREYEGKKGFGKANFTPLLRKGETPSKTPNARTIDFNLSSTSFNVHYEYDPGTNSYKRSEGGAAHRDERSNAQLLPKVVVALIMPQGKNDIYTTYQTIGSGTALVFQDGNVTEATWRKDSNSAQFSFINKDGQALGLNPGQTWFTALGGADRATFAP